MARVFSASFFFFFSLLAFFSAFFARFRAFLSFFFSSLCFLRHFACCSAVGLFVGLPQIQQMPGVFCLGVLGKDGSPAPESEPAMADA